MKWLSIHIGGQLWQVHLVSSRHGSLKAPKGQRCYARALYDKCRIYIDKSASPEQLEDTLLHELLHGVLSVAGASNEMKNGESEERIVTAVTPVLHRLLKDLGFTFPKAGVT